MAGADSLRPPSAAEREGEWDGTGLPLALADLLDWPARALHVLASRGEMRAHLSRNLRQGVSLRTHYSGMGTAEMSLQFLQAELAGQGGQGIGIVPIHACDLNEDCRQLLCAWRPRSHRPLHVFGDINDRLTPRHREVLNRIEPLWHASKARQDVGTETLRRLRRMASYLLHHATEIFTATRRAECAVHNSRCLCSTHQFRGAARTALKLVIAGSTCVAHSSRGLHLGMMDASFRPFMLFITEVRQMRPHLVLHECTSRFPTAWLQAWLGDLYTMTVFQDISPHQLGWPVRRPRQYTLLSCKERCVFLGTCQDFLALLGQPTVAGGEIFFRG